MSRATEDSLSALHGILADALTAEIREAQHRAECAECGQRPGIPPTLLAQAIKFLKDNGIDTPASTGSRVDTLKAAMPDMDQLEAAGNVLPFGKK